MSTVYFAEKKTTFLVYLIKLRKSNFSEPSNFNFTAFTKLSLFEIKILMNGALHIHSQPEVKFSENFEYFPKG